MSSPRQTAPRVSVVMPFHDAEETLGEALDSIRGQTLADWECIAFDDGSTDASRPIARARAAADPRIRVIASTHLGIVEALRRGCAEARGEYIARMDADDVAHPQRLAAQRARMEQDPRLGLCGARVRMTGQGIGSGRRRYERWLNSLTTPEQLDRDLFVECPVAHPAFFLRRAAYAAVGGYAERGWAEDYDLVMRLRQAGWRMANVPEVLLDWRHRTGRLSMTDTRYDEARFRALKRHYLEAMDLAAGRPLYQWGAGEVGKRWLREWTEPHPLAAVDIHPRKVGTRIHRTDIIPPQQLPPPGEAFVVVLVGAPGARADIRHWFADHGYLERRDFRFFA